jgi:hypothetical protein
MAKKPVVKGVSVLRVPFGSPFTGPAKRFAQDLQEMSRQCDVCRNAMLRHWIRWHEDNPNYEVKPKLEDDGTPKKNKKGEPVFEDRYFPYCLTSSTSQESMYRRGQRACPDLAAKIIATIAKETESKLKARVPYNYKGIAKTHGEGIFLNEISPDNNSARNIPMPCQDAVLAYEGIFSKKADKGTQAYGKSGCLLRFPLFSDKAGRKFTSLICNLDISKFTPGQKEVIRKICKQEWKLHDSKILSADYKVGNKMQKGWFFNLTYIQPRKDLGLKKENTATLFSNPKNARQAFQVKHDAAIWQVGYDWYKNQVHRLTIRRKAIRYRYKSDIGKGHGKARFFNALRPYSRSIIDAQSRFQWLCVNDIIKFCVKNNCGTLVYREPSLGLRNFNTWFNQQGLTFAWDKFSHKLAHKCHIYGIELVKERIKKAEYDTIFPLNKAS